MSFNSQSIFRARQVRETSPLRTTPEDKKTTLASGGYSALELTKTKKFCVSRLPAVPSVLEDGSKSSFLNGYSDNGSNYALIVNDTAIHVWNYKSTDSSPLTIQFPLDLKPSELPPLAILTKPSSGTSDDPGIMIIDSVTGLVKFYESVQHAPALGLIDNKLLELRINLNEKSGEYITSADSVEPAGIVITTSWKRCVLVALRDLKGKPRLATFDLLNSTFNRGLISGLFGKFGNREKNEFVNDEVVSVKSGRIFDHGMSQEIIIQDSVGQFYLFTYHLMSANGVPFIDEKKSFMHNLSPYLENNMHGFLPGSSINIKFLDLWPLNSKKHDNKYLGLCQLDNMFRQDSERELVLAVMRIDSTGVLLLSSHRVQRTPSSIGSIENKPRLFLPVDYNTVFITIGNTVMLVDLGVTNDNLSKTFKYYQPKWEDLIRFKPSVNIIGQGFEDRVSNSNSAIILITAGSGVIRIERFGRDHDSIEIDDSQPDSVSQKIESHMEQAIFYSTSSDIDFDVTDDYDAKDVIKATNNVIGQILRASSPYIPSFLPAVADFLSMKSRLFHELLRYTSRNFPALSERLVPVIIKNLEMNEVALNLWNFMDGEGSNSESLKKRFEKILLAGEDIDRSDHDILRSFFCRGVENINARLNSFIEQLVSENYSLEKVVQMIVQTIHDGFYGIEAKYIMGNSNIPSTKLWIFDTTLLITIENVFAKVYCESENDHNIITQNSRWNLVKICKVLYYLVNYAINYMTLNENANGQLKEYIKWYHSRKTFWINALLREGLYSEATQIAEQYEDFSSLIYILESERQKTVDNGGEIKEESKNFNTGKYELYFERFGYDFALCLFEHCLKSGKIRLLLLGFPKYTDYLERYLTENPEKASHVSWIRYLIIQDFSKSVQALINSASLRPDDDLDSLHSKYSLAKLSATAALARSQMDNFEELKDMIALAEDNLISIRAQHEVHSYISKYVSGQKQLLSLDYILKNFINDSLDYTTARSLIEPACQRFIDGNRLPTADLINMLTLIKPTAGFSHGFPKALFVSLTIPDKHVFKTYCQITWLRLLTLVDDWPSIASTKYKADTFVKESACDTVLYKTLSAIRRRPELLVPLDELLGSNSEVYITGDSRLDDLSRKLRNKLDTYMEDHDLMAWVDAIKQAIKSS